MPTPRTRATRIGLARSFACAARSVTKPGAASLAMRAQSIPRLLRAVDDGSYLGVRRTQLFAVLAAVLYVASPVDVVPEALFGLFGLGDDALVAAWAATSLIRMTDDYLDWEAHRG